MKNFFLLLLIFISNFLFAQNNQGKCKLIVEDVSKIVSFGYLVSYTVEFKNSSNKTVDEIVWDATFYDNNGVLITKESSSFNATNIINPIASGFTKTLVRSPKVKGASKVFIRITKVHFVDGSSCN